MDKYLFIHLSFKFVFVLLRIDSQGGSNYGGKRISGRNRISGLGGGGVLIIPRIKKSAIVTILLLLKNNLIKSYSFICILWHLDLSCWKRTITISFIIWKFLTVAWSLVIASIIFQWNVGKNVKKHHPKNIY